MTLPTKIQAIVLAILWILLSQPLFAQTEDLPCDTTDVEDLADFIECETGKNPEVCASVGLTLAATASSIKLNGLFDKAGAMDPQVLKAHKAAVAAVLKASAKAQREVRAFTRAVAKASAIARQAGPIKIKGYNKFNDAAPTWGQLYSTHKAYIDAVLPNNEFARKLINTMLTPEIHIHSAIRAAGAEATKSLPQNQKPSFANFIKLEQLRYNEFFYKTQERYGIYLRVKAIVVDPNREATLQQLKESRKQITTLRSFNQKMCGRVPKAAAAALGLGGMSEIASATTAWKAVDSCSEEFNTKLTAEDKMFLIEATQLKGGASKGVGCDQFDLDAKAVHEVLNAKPGTYSKGLEEYLCRFSRKQYANKARVFEKRAETEVSCNRVAAGSSVASLNGPNLEIKLKAGGTVTLPKGPQSAWGFTSLKSTNPRFQDFLINKVRHPAISQEAKKDVMTTEYACNPAPTTPNDKDLCELAQSLDAWNHFSRVAQDKCTPSNASEEATTENNN